MRSLLTFCFALSFFIPSFSSLEAQIYFDYKNVKEKSVYERNAFKREAWFYERRMGSNGFPKDVFAKALQERKALRNAQGFFLNSENIWTSVGPTPGTYGLSGSISSRIATVKYHPTNPNIIYIGGAYGGVWKTTDGGITWVPKTDNEVSMSSGSICIDPANPEIVYYGTGEASYSGTSYTGRGLLKSTNGGDTWINYTQGLPINTYCSRIVIRPGHSNELLFAAGTYGLFRSTTSGSSWSTINSGRCDDVIFSPTGDTCYIIGSGTGYKISTDGGATFIINPAPFTVGSRSHFGLCKAFPNIMYAATLVGSEVIVYKSTDAGFTYARVGNTFNFTGSLAWYCFYTHVSPFEPNLTIVGTFNIQRTTNGGANWQYIIGDMHSDEHNMDFNPVNPNEFVASNDGGIWKTTNRGTNWINLNNNLTLTQFYKIASAPNNVNHIIGGTQDNGGQRTTGSIAWSNVISGDGGVISFNKQNPDFVLGESQNNFVLRSTNGGANFTTAQTGLYGSGAWISPIIAHPDSSGIFYTGRQQIFKTVNNGAAWDSISTPGGTLDLISISKNNPAVIYCSAGQKIFKSTNRGYNWVNISAGLSSYYIQAIDVHPDSFNVLVVGTSSLTNKIFKSTNGGNSWINISSNLPSALTNDVMFYYPGFATNSVLTAMDAGVFISNNNGASWEELGTGLPNTICMDLDFNQSANRLRVGTHGRGVWEINGTISGITGQSNNSPNEYSLSQNYPNPFNPVTKINYTVRKQSIVSLKVFDMIGREVSIVVNKFQNPGTYEVVFDGSKLSSGIYFYVLKAGDFQESKKMILTK